MKKMSNCEDGYFAVPIDNKYALFAFKPRCLMTEILDSLNIPYEVFDSRKDLKKYRRVVKDKRTKATMYKLVPGIGGFTYRFFFTSDIIDKILDHYNVGYVKEG